MQPTGAAGTRRRGGPGAVRPQPGPMPPPWPVGGTVGSRAVGAHVIMHSEDAQCPSPVPGPDLPPAQQGPPRCRAL